MSQLKALSISKHQSKLDDKKIEDIHLNQIITGIPLLEELTIGCKILIIQETENLTGESIQTLKELQYLRALRFCINSLT